MSSFGNSSRLHDKLWRQFKLSTPTHSEVWGWLSQVPPVSFVMSIFLFSPYSVCQPNRSPPGAATKVSQKETSLHGAWTSTTRGLFWQTKVIFLYFTGIGSLSSLFVLPRAPCLFLKWNRIIKKCQMEHFWITGAPYCSHFPGHLRKWESFFLAH